MVTLFMANGFREISNIRAKSQVRFSPIFFIRMLVEDLLGSVGYFYELGF